MQMRSLRIPLAPFFVIALAAGCATKPNDAQLATNLKAQMFSDPQTKSADLQVAVKNGVVTLSGTAPSDAARYEAYKLATSMAGVRKVNDQVTVQAPETAGATPPPAVAPSVKTSPRRETKRERERLRRVSKKHPRHAPTTESATKAPAQPATAPAQTPAPTTPAAAATTPAAPPAAATPAATPAPAAAPPPPPPPVTAIFPAGTTVEIQTVDPIDSKTGQAGDQFQATLAQPLTWDSRVLVPKGANLYLRLVAAQTSGQYKGQSELQLRLVRLEFQGTAYPLTSTTYTQAGGSRSTDTAKKVGGGAVLGAIIGAIAGGGKGAAIGGAAGAGAGGVYQGASKPKQVRIPAETVLDFKLDQPLNIPVPATGGAQ
jgi:BON domain